MVVEPTHLQYAQVKMGDVLPQLFGVKIKDHLKPTPRKRFKFAEKRCVEDLLEFFFGVRVLGGSPHLVSPLSEVIPLPKWPKLLIN